MALKTTASVTAAPVASTTASVVEPVTTMNTTGMTFVKHLYMNESAAYQLLVTSMGGWYLLLLLCHEYN